MNRALLLFLLFASSLISGCKKWVELTETTIKSVTINGAKYEYNATYRPVLGSHEIGVFEFSDTREIGIYHFYLPSGIVINFIIKCNYADYAPRKKFILQSPLIAPDSLYTLIDKMWTPEVVQYIPDESDGIAFMYGWGKYDKHNPIGLSGYLVVQERNEDRYFQNNFELSSDSIPPVLITDGFFLTSKM